MPAATTKAGLLDVTRRQYDKLTGLFARIPPEMALVPFDDDTSIKDVIGHRAHWIGLFLGWVDDGVAGRTVHIPAKGYKWSDLKAYNAQLRVDQQGLDWPQACELLEQNHTALIALVERLTQDQLYGAVMPGHHKWTTGRFAEASGASHYRSAAKFIRACLRQADHSG